MTSPSETTAAPASGDVAREAGRRRTFAIISHPDAGKSTMTEALALHAQVITEAGAVHGKSGRRSTVSDWMDMEKARGISITSAALQFAYGDHVINLVDTPGHSDFSEDTYRVLSAVDCAVMLIDAAKGLEPQTLKLFRVCKAPRPAGDHGDQQVGPARARGAGADGRDLPRHRSAADPADLAGRDRRRLQGRAGAQQR